MSGRRKQTRRLSGTVARQRALESSGPDDGLLRKVSRARSVRRCAAGETVSSASGVVFILPFMGAGRWATACRLLAKRIHADMTVGVFPGGARAVRRSSPVCDPRAVRGDTTRRDDDRTRRRLFAAHQPPEKLRGAPALSLEIHGDAGERHRGEIADELGVVGAEDKPCLPERERQRRGSDAGFPALTGSPPEKNPARRRR